MKARKQLRFDMDTVRKLAGDKVYARGEDYHHAELVEILTIDPNRVVAQVEGTEDYRTVLVGHGANIGGECSCPAFENWGFCKHMVAVALGVNEVGDTGVPGGTGAPEGGGALMRIRDHLKTRGAEALVDMIVELAEGDPDLFRKLDVAAAMDQADDKTLGDRLRKALDHATRTTGYIDYREAPGWADGVEVVLDAIAGLVSASRTGRAGLARGLVEHAISRIEEAIGEIDDSDGHCGFLLERAQEIHLSACRITKPGPIKLARDLFARELKDEYGTFYKAAMGYADVLGEKGLAEYRRLAAAAWKKLPPRAGGGREHHDFSRDYSRLEDMLDFFAERDGDVEARIAIRAKDLSSPWNYLQLAEFCLSQGLEEEALRHAEEGLWVFESEQPDERLVFFAVDLLLGAGRKADAGAHLWQVFEKKPSLELYKRLGKSGGKPARERAIAQLKERLAKDKRTSWGLPADLLIRVLMEEKSFEAAWAVVREYGASKELKGSLAKASETAHPDDALKVYAERVEDLVKAGGNPGYEQARGLITRMAALRSAGEQTAYVADLKERFRRKRNFIKLMG